MQCDACKKELPKNNGFFEVKTVEINLWTWPGGNMRYFPRVCLIDFCPECHKDYLNNKENK